MMREPAEFAGPARTGEATPGLLGIDPDAQEWIRSGDGDGAIEVAFPLPPGTPGWERGDWVLMRVAGDDTRRVLAFTRHEWTCFLDGVRKGEFDAAAQFVRGGLPAVPGAGPGPGPGENL